MKHRSDVEAWAAVVACLPDDPHDPDGALPEDEKPKARLLSLLAGTHQYSGNVRLARTCAAATGHAILDGRARVARLTEALRWARRYATGFDHEHDCPRRTGAQRAVESCTCGYASLGEPIDAILERGMTVFVECPKCHTVTYPEGVVDRAELIAATAAAEAAGKVQAELDREREHRASERALLEQRAKDLTSELEGRSESLRRERAAADSYGAALRVAEDKVRGLAQRIDAARLVLDRIQWAAGGACPSCRGPLGAENVQQDGHARDCELAKLLRVSP